MCVDTSPDRCVRIVAKGAYSKRGASLEELDISSKELVKIMNIQPNATMTLPIKYAQTEYHMVNHNEL